MTFFKKQSVPTNQNQNSTCAEDTKIRQNHIQTQTHVRITPMPNPQHKFTKKHIEKQSMKRVKGKKLPPQQKQQ